MMFCGVDNGSGTIADACGNITMTAVNAPGEVSTANGKAIHWPGTENTHIGYYGDPYAYNPIRTATNLANQGAGAAWTFGLCWMQLAITGTDACIGGRPARAGENQPYANWTFNVRMNSSTIYAAVNNAGTIQQVGSDYTGSALNQFNTLIMTAENTSSGVATCKFYANGVQVGSDTAGIVVTDSALAGSGADGETQIMFGTIYHVDTTFNFNCINGVTYMENFTPRKWTPTEIIEYTNAPFSSFLSF